MFIIVEMKLIAPRIEDIPAICREKITRSTDGPLWNILDVRGGYRIHPAPVLIYIKFLKIRRFNEGGRNQNLMLFIRG